VHGSGTVDARFARYVDFDYLDDELFSTDYRSSPHVRHATVLPEVPTVRLSPRTPDVTEPPTVRLAPRPPGYVMAPVYIPVPIYISLSGDWAGEPYNPTAPYAADENGAEIVALVGLAVLLVVAVAGVGIMLWWWGV
jgi:hypothetical protein